MNTLFSIAHGGHIETVVRLEHHVSMDEIKPMLGQVGLALGFIPSINRFHVIIVAALGG